LRLITHRRETGIGPSVSGGFRPESRRPGASGRSSGIGAERIDRETAAGGGPGEVGVDGARADGSRRAPDRLDEARRAGRWRRPPPALVGEAA